MPAATAAAEPLEEPPGVHARSWGLRVLPGAREASSVVTVLPAMIAPLRRSIATTAASPSARRPACSTVPFSVGRSLVSMMSLMPTGTPWSGPRLRPLRRSSSARRAWSSACSRSMNVQAPTSRSRASIWARQAFIRSSELSSPSRMAFAASVARIHCRPSIVFASSSVWNVLEQPYTRKTAPARGFRMPTTTLTDPFLARQCPALEHQRTRWRTGSAQPREAIATAHWRLRRDALQSPQSPRRHAGSAGGRGRGGHRLASGQGGQSGMDNHRRVAPSAAGACAWRP